MTIMGDLFGELRSEVQKKSNADDKRLFELMRKVHRLLGASLYESQWTPYLSSVELPVFWIDAHWKIDVMVKVLPPQARAAYRFGAFPLGPDCLDELTKRISSVRCVGGGCGR